MALNSIEFILFLFFSTFLYYLLPQKVRFYFLLMLSIVFYAFWSTQNTILLIISALFTYGIGILCERTPTQEPPKVPFDSTSDDAGRTSERFFKILDRKKCLIIGILFLLGELFVFKYFNFTIREINSLFKVLNQNTSMIVSKLIMPVGVSFYVFQSIGYLVDIYNGKIQAERNIVKFLLFITFFPKIIQGPIERSTGFLMQISDIENRSKFNYQRIQNGLITILWGFFLKMVIADRLGIVVDTVFSKYFLYGTIELLFTSICYTLQIYCDFAGYSSIALGAAQLFGFELIQNFDCPYFSGSLKEFWRRWHISLSQWFRDYVYIPLGGSRCSAFRKRLNIFLVMLVSGIWHGAGWTFITWGVIHGLYQVIEDITTPLIWRLNRKFHVPDGSISYKLGNMFITFNLVNLAWIFFRAESIRIACDYIGCMLTNYNPWAFFNGSLLKLGLDLTEMKVLMAAMIILVIVELVQYRYKSRLAEMLQEQCFWFRWAVIILLITFVWVFGEYGPLFESSNFIYQGF